MRLYNSTSEQWIDGPEAWLDVFDNLSATGPDGETSDETESETGLEKLKLADLKVIAQDREIDVTGLRTKAEFVTAIRDHVAASETGSLAPAGGVPDGAPAPVDDADQQ